jgi:WD40 repeat protein
MKFLTCSLLIAAVLLSACGGSNNTNATPTTAVSATSTQSPATVASESTATPTTSPEPAASATPAATSTPTPVPVQAIDAENFASLKAVSEVTVGEAQFLAWQDDGKLLVASSKQAVLVEPGSNTTTTVYTASGDELILAVSEHGQIAVSADHLTIDVYSLSGDLQSTFTAEGPIGSVDFSHDGTLLAVSRVDVIAVDLWDIAAAKLSQAVTGFQTAAPVYAAFFSPDDKKLIWVSRATVQTSDIASGAFTPKMEHELFVSGFALNSNGSLLATTSGESATLWNPETAQSIQDLDQGTTALQPAFLPGSGLLLVATDTGVLAWDTQSYQQLATLDTPARQIRVTGDGASLATVDMNGLVKIWVVPAP